MGLGLEDVGKLAQKYVANCPVIVLGTGASIPNGLPSMSQLARELLNRVAVDENEPDARLWDAFKKKLAETEDLEQSLHEIDLSDSLLTAVIAHTWDYINECDIAVHNALLAAQSQLPLTRLLRHILRTAQATACIVTTNYDRLAEYAASVAGAAFFTGFAPGFFSRFTPSNSQGGGVINFPGKQGHVHIWKVHGSVDWFTDRLGEAVSLQGAHAIPDGFTPLIVTPGISKYRKVHQDPFRTVITQADAALEQASGFLCIGYGFNDEHIQPKLLSRHRRGKVPIVAVTKSLTPKAKELLIENSRGEYLALEEADNGTRAYTPDFPDGTVVDGLDAWDLSNFLDMAIGERS